MKKKISIGIFSFLIVFVVCFFAGKAFSGLQDIKRENEIKEEAKTQSVSEEGTHEIGGITEGKVEKSNSEKQYKVGDEVETENLLYTVNSYKISKKLPNTVHSLKGEDWIGLKDGRLEEGYSYINLNITIKNTDQEIRELGLNSIKIYCCEDDTYSKLLETSADILTASNKGKLQNKDFFIVQLNPKEQQTYDISYIICDKEWNSKYMYVYINNTGMEKPGDVARKIILK